MMNNVLIFPVTIDKKIIEAETTYNFLNGGKTLEVKITGIFFFEFNVHSVIEFLEENLIIDKEKWIAKPNIPFFSNETLTSTIILEKIQKIV
ncbi:MAG: hypothetical protein PHX25_02195 [Candidatus Pacebacteria bacterium]|nr:hypothetical protein [Candidatus Paceibacterota bacterium]